MPFLRPDTNAIVITHAQAAELLCRKKDEILSMIASGELRGIRKGRTNIWLLLRSDVEAYAHRYFSSASGTVDFKPAAPVTPTESSITEYLNSIRAKHREKQAMKQTLNNARSLLQQHPL